VNDEKTENIEIKEDLNKMNDINIKTIEQKSEGNKIKSVNNNYFSYLVFKIELKLKKKNFFFFFKILFFTASSRIQSASTIQSISDFIF